MNQQPPREEITALIKERADIVQIISQHVDLKKSGARYLGLCPFHGEKTPSFSVHPGQQFFHCFGCGESGDVFSFMMKYHNLDFPGALKELAQRCNVTLPQRPRSAAEEKRRQQREQLYAVNGKVAEIYHEYLLGDGGLEARRYLQRRGVDGSAVETFRLGYAPAVEVGGWNYLGSRLTNNEQQVAVVAGVLVAKEKGGTYDRFRDRIIFPIAEISGRVCGFGGRIVGQGQPKYLNSPESAVFNKSKLLFGLYEQKEDIRRQRQAVLVEGNFDLVSLVVKGLPQVVAPLGTALTREQLRLLKRFCDEAVLLFDGDSAGLKAAVRSAPLFLAEQMTARVALLPTGEDPDSYVRKEGLAALNRILAEAESLPEFLFQRWVEEYGFGLDGKAKLVEELRPLVAAAASPLQRSVIIAHFAEKLGMAGEELQHHLDRKETVATTRPVQRVKEEDAISAPLTLAQKQVLTFMILHPQYLVRLAQLDVRDWLAGGIGEIIFLQLRQILEKKGTAEPEELLNVLPEGTERRFVVEVLTRARDHRQDGEDESSAAELESICGYLQRSRLHRKSQKLMRRIEQAQEQGREAELEELMAEKMSIARILHGEEG